jgi:uncharacterized protein YecT (DUF1311 family)
MRVHRRLWSLLIVASFWWGTPAFADWATIGVAWDCDTAAGQLTIVGTVESSDDESNVDPPEGFSALRPGEHELRCKMGSVLVLAKVFVHPPQARGMCMGGGYISVDKFSIGGVPLFPNTQSFNWSCSESFKPLMRISVQVRESQVQVEQCFANWDWTVRYGTPQCRPENPQRFRASFDCTKSTMQLERLICESANLSRLDHELFATYQEVMRHQRSAAPLRKTQREWLRQERASCADEPCLQRAYAKRIEELRLLIPKVDTRQLDF